MRILSIHDGHTATATLMGNGKIAGMVSEERFTKKKNQGGFPYNSISWLLKTHDLQGAALDYIVMPGLIDPLLDINSEKRVRHEVIGKLSRVVPRNILTIDLFTKYFVDIEQKKRRKLLRYQKQLRELGIDKDKISFVEHHKCHAATAYYMDNNYSDDRKVLVFTLDGSGDGLSATVNIGQKNRLERRHSIHSYNSLGMVYSAATSYLGMKALEHEYKLMGMAPYAPQRLIDKSYNIFKKYIKLDSSGLSFVNISGVYGYEMIKKFKEDLFKHRFDGVAGGLQKLTEELALQWILNWVRKTGINNIAVAGGVFMNVKLNMLINENKEIASAFFMPSCGDESISLGAALEKIYGIERQNYVNPNFDNLYFGPEYSNDEIEAILKKHNGFKYNYYDDINDKVAELLKENKIIGRLQGKMEFGARSLGNRAIIANPQNYDIVSKINRAIKKRDFWMPFAPSILPEGGEKYLKSNKEKKAPFMILGFETNEIAQTEIMAGLHQADFSCRPQIVEKEANPMYYDLIMKFKDKTGLLGILNTSFNIHGYPIVNSPSDALWTLENSDLDAVQLENFLVEKLN